MRLLLLLIPCILFAESIVESKKAFYKENELILEDEVFLTHPLGNLHAGRALLKRGYSQMSGPFQKFILQRNVSIDLPDHGSIRCERATLDMASLRGDFSSLHEKVQYKEFVQSQKLQLEAHLVRFKMHKASEKVDIDSITAKDGVEITYGDHIKALSDVAVYRKYESKANSELPPGIVKLYPKSADKRCQLTFHNDEIEAGEIQFDTLRGEIRLAAAKGLLHINKSYPIAFQADHLIWNQNDDLLTLSGSVIFKTAESNFLKTSDKLRLKRIVQNNQSSLASLDSFGTSEIAYLDPSGKKHTLITEGPLHWSRDNNQLITEKSKNGAQVLYSHEDVNVSSDRLVVSGIFDQSAFHPTNVQFFDNLKVAGNQPFQLAIAKEISYNLDKETLTCFGDDETRVLFWREENNVIISADQLKIFRGETQRVEGMGLVRCEFNEDEKKLFKRVFE